MLSVPLLLLLLLLLPPSNLTSLLAAVQVPRSASPIHLSPHLPLLAHTPSVFLLLLSPGLALLSLIVASLQCFPSLALLTFV